MRTSCESQRRRVLASGATLLPKPCRTPMWLSLYIFLSLDAQSMLLLIPTGAGGQRVHKTPRCVCLSAHLLCGEELEVEAAGPVGGCC
jgi:hypothetical protein